jgi:uncharacterized membrane protein
MSENPYDPYGAGPRDPYSQSPAGQGLYGAQQPIVDPYAGDPRNNPASHQQPIVDPYAGSQPYAQNPYTQNPYIQNPYGQAPVPLQQPYAQGFGQMVPADAGIGNVAPNLWLSVFFGWIPALIYYLANKDTSSPVVRKVHADNLNFQLIRVIVCFVPYLGMLAALVLFVIAIVHAVQIPAQVRSGQQPRFTLTPNWIN